MESVRDPTYEPVVLEIVMLACDESEEHESPEENDPAGNNQGVPPTRILRPIRKSTGYPAYVGYPVVYADKRQSERSGHVQIASPSS